MSLVTVTHCLGTILVLRLMLSLAAPEDPLPWLARLPCWEVRVVRWWHGVGWLTLLRRCSLDPHSGRLGVDSWWGRGGGGTKYFPVPHLA